MTLNKIFKNTLILISACLLLSACATQKTVTTDGSQTVSYTHLTLPTTPYV